MKENRFNLYRWTADSRTYRMLRRHDKTKCPYCLPNGGCNTWGKKRSYDKSIGVNRDGSIKYETEFKYPSWKLSTKNRKQWMEKNLKKKISRYKTHFGESIYIELTWDREICSNRDFEEKMRNMIPSCWL